MLLWMEPQRKYCFYAEGQTDPNTPECADEGTKLHPDLDSNELKDTSAQDELAQGQSLIEAKKRKIKRCPKPIACEVKMQSSPNS